MKKYVLGNICSIQSGGTPKRSKDEYFNSSFIPWVKIGDLGDSEVITQTKEFISEKGLETIGNKTVSEGTILLAMYGATLGKTGIAGTKLSTNQAILGINSLNEHILLNKYLKYWLDFNVKKFQFEGKGGAYKNLSKTYIENLPINLPDVDTQGEFLKRIESIQSLKQKRKRTIELLDEYLDSVFLEMFGDPLLNDKNWDLTEVDNVVNKIYSGWSPKGEKRRKKKNEVGVLKVSAITGGTFNPNEYKTVSGDNLKKNLIFPKKGDLLMTRANTREKVAAICIVNENYDDLFLSDKIWLIKEDREKVTSTFLNMIFSHEAFRKVFSKKANSSSGSMVNISQNQFLNHLIPNAPLKLQRKFETLYFVIDNQKKFHTKSQNLLEELFESLIYQTFNPDKQKEIDKRDEVEKIIDDEVEVEILLNSLNTADYSSVLEYDIDVKKLRGVLLRTEKELKEDANFQKGIVQIKNGKKIELKTTKDYQKELIDEATKA